MSRRQDQRPLHWVTGERLRDRVEPLDSLDVLFIGMDLQAAAPPSTPAPVVLAGGFDGRMAQERGDLDFR